MTASLNARNPTAPPGRAAARPKATTASRPRWCDGEKAVLFGHADPERWQKRTPAGRATVEADVRRRRAIAVLGSALGAPMLMSPESVAALVAWGDRVRAGPKPSGGVTSQEAGLTDGQARTMEALAEVIIPETDTPGASEAGVSEFVDALVRGWLDPPERDRLLDGLDSVDGTARERFGSDFPQCTLAEQDEIVGELDDELTRLRTGDPSTAESHFFHDVKHFTLAGYFTSRVGLEVLGHRTVYRTFEGCAPLTPTDAEPSGPASGVHFEAASPAAEPEECRS